MIVDVVIPALNEEQAIGLVIDEIPKDHVRRIVVADNGSTDSTASVAADHGAEVVHEAERGYGAACLKALASLAASPPEVVVFLDGDHSDFPAELPKLLGPICDGTAQLVIGSRVLGQRERGSLTPQQRVGNWLACQLLHRLYGVRYSDLGPFRAITWPALQSLAMRDRNFGWTVEMQINAARLGVPSAEVPVSYRPRIGESKVSGTVRGSVAAGRKILWLLARDALRRAS